MERGVRIENVVQKCTFPTHCFLRNDVEIRIFPNLPHGFLNMGLVVHEALEAIRHISKWIAKHSQVEWCGNVK